MKHIKLFENTSDIVKVTVVDFTGGNDGVFACYVDGVLEFYGDYYHDKIENKIDGFISGLKWIKKNYVYPLEVQKDEFACTNEQMIESISEIGDAPPRNLKDVLTPNVNELFGVNNAFKMLRNKDESEANEIKILVSKKKYTSLKYDEKKEKKIFIKSYSFDIESHASGVDHESVRVEFHNWIHPIKAPGATDYFLFYNNKRMECTREISKKIWDLLYKKK